MKRKKKGAVEWLVFDLLEAIPGLVHGVFLRGNDIDLKEMSDILGVDRWVTAQQVHGAKIANVPHEETLGCDALLTQTTNLALSMRHADCQVAIIYDPKNHAVAEVHCGWRGNVQNIYEHTVKKMQEEIGSDPRHLIVGISPSLGPDASEFINYQLEFPSSFLPFQHKPNYFNLWEVSRKQLIEVGVAPHHIEIASICTLSNSPDFFSYRRDKTSARNRTLVALK